MDAERTSVDTRQTYVDKNQRLIITQLLWIPTLLARLLNIPVDVLLGGRVAEEWQFVNLNAAGWWRHLTPTEEKYIASNAFTSTEINIHPEAIANKNLRIIFRTEESYGFTTNTLFYLCGRMAIIILRC